ncbi:MAG: hypothetical protein JSS02_34815 [Planctomycetes bacterium]|nr:hypothetical protein [Planctomycetota bacterium]
MKLADSKSLCAGFFLLIASGVISLADDELPKAAPPKPVPPVAPQQPPAVPPPVVPPRPNQENQRRNKVTVRQAVVNGETQMDIEENGVKIWIKHRNRKNIQMTITQPDDDPDDEIEPDQETFEAKDVRELRENYPEAYEYFERYAMPEKGNVPGFGLPVPGLPGFPGGQRGPRMLFRNPPFGGGFGFGGDAPAPPAQEGSENNKRLSELNAELKQYAEELQELTEKTPIDLRKLREISKHLHDVQKKMAETLKPPRQKSDGAGEDADDEVEVGP